MPTIGFHASHELHPPGELLARARRAERLGFGAAMCSDHFHPWTTAQGQSGYSWSWLGAALQATSLSLGVVCSPGRRQHPALVAQAAATLEQMFPGRFWLAVGTGQYLNESIVGGPWPSKPDRLARLRAAVEVMRALWAGETVDRDGPIRVQGATLFSRPDRPPPLYGAALTPETARWVGSWADGLITVSAPPEELRRLVDAFREGGGEGKPMVLQAAFALGRDEEAALRAARECWPVAALPIDVNQNLPNPAAFDAATADVKPEDLRGKVRATGDPARIVDWLRGDAEVGFDPIYVYDYGREPDRFLDAVAEHVLPAFAKER